MVHAVVNQVDVEGMNIPQISVVLIGWVALLVDNVLVFGGQGLFHVARLKLRLNQSITGVCRTSGGSKVLCSKQIAVFFNWENFALLMQMISR